MRGTLVALEGIDNETLIALAEKLVNQFKENDGLNVVVTQEPTNGPLGTQLRLLENKRIDIQEYARAVLSVADRMDHFYGVDNVEKDGVIADLQKGKIVLCIGYLLSSFAVQNDSISIDWLMQINQYFPWPDLMVFIDVPVEVVLTRIIQENGFDDGVISHKREELTALRASYLKVIELLRGQGKKIHVVESDNINVAYRSCVKLLEELLNAS